MKQRRYTLRQRAESQAQTRQRIVEAAVALHGTLGPAHTTMSAVAERAGVQRHTLYRHFPDELAVLRACSQHFIGTHPLPDVHAWGRVAPGRRRLGKGLAELYAYFATNRQMIGNVLRDAEFVPVGAGFRQAIDEAARTLADGWRVSSPERLRSALRLATDFFAWRLLADTGLEPSSVTGLMTDMVAGAARAGRATGGRGSRLRD